MSPLINNLTKTHDRFFSLVSKLQSPFLLFVRLYWGGYQLAYITGLGHLRHLDKVAEYFASLNMPMPAESALIISCVEFVGGIFLAIGLFSRITALVLTINMLSAYIIGDREAFLSFFSDPDKFSAAAPYVFLIASLIILVFGPGKFCVDTLVRRFTHLSDSSSTEPHTS
jgi:putative oxidoreductase